MELQINQSIGDYGILRELGSGGMGRVYEAIHSVTHRHEAIKILDVNAPTSDIQSDRFLREIRLQAALNHPNIAAVHNAFWNEDSLVLVCELLEGESLKTLLDRGPLSLTRSIAVVAQVLSALSYAHARGVIHRDVSPSNIFVTSASGAVKLIDFGLAKTTSDLNLTQPGVPAGSYHYMSPEQIQGGLSLDARVDVYSCGAVLFELATGRKLFEDDSAFALMQAHCEREPDSPRSLNPEIPKELENVILKALAKNPEDRFQSADSFARALCQVSLGLAVPVALPDTRRPNARLYAVGLSLAAAVVAAGVFYPMLHTKASASVVTVAPPMNSLALTSPMIPDSTRAMPAVAVAPVKSAPQPRLAVVKPTSPEIVAEQELFEEAALASPEKKAPPKVVRAIKWLNPFRKKPEAEPAMEGQK